MPVILIEHGPGGRPALFESPVRLLVAYHPEEVAPVLAEAEAARLAGGWIAGYLGYEAGHMFEARLRCSLKPDPGAPLVALGVFEGPQAADDLIARAEAQCENVLLAPLRPQVSRVQYEAAFARLQAYIGSGDCYQVNLTFPMETRLFSGLALGLYGALRVRQSVGFGAFIDLTEGPVIISRSPELFFRVRDGVIESRPMKGTAPRSPDAREDMRLKTELAASAKVQAENLMIVDLLRNDIARVSRIGSVRVPELFAIDSYATVHQMSSRIQGRLVEGAGLPDLMAALFPCGSVTGAPKIRAMQIIAELEPFPRGVYCGAIGWAAPSGDQCWSVAIRSLRLFEDGRILANVGGGVVQDSTAEGEWEEALWKTRYLQGLVGRD